MTQSHTRTAAALLKPVNRTSLSAWRLSPDNPRHEARPLPIDNHLPLTQLAQELAVHCQHKDHFAIRVLDMVTGKAVVHFYAIKRESKAQWRRDPATGQSVCVARLYPVLLFSMAALAFEPNEAFAWAPGADVVGADRNIIEGVQA